MTLVNDRYTYRVVWSEEDEEHAGQCAEFPSLSWLAATPEEALAGIRAVAAEVVADMRPTLSRCPSPSLPGAIAAASWCECHLSCIDAWR